MSEEQQLPNGWELTTLGKLANYINGRAFKPKDWGDIGRPIIRIQNLTGSTNTINRFSGAVEPKYIIRDGDLLISWSATLGAFIYQGEEAVLNQHIFKVEPFVNKKFLFYLVKAYLDTLKRQVHGSGMQHITKGKFDNSPVPLPPPDEQKRIADKLDALLARVEQCQAHLDRVPALLKAFRQSVLAAATSGRLTEDWREAKGISIEDWDTKTGNEIFPFITSGSRGWAEYYSESGAIFLRIGNLDHDTIELDLEKIQYVNPPVSAEGKRTLVQVGDILISITADVGMVGYVRETIGEAYINQHICLARQTGEYVGEFLAYYLTSPVGGLGQLTKVQRGATKAGLTLGDIRELTFQIPSLEEQHEIVRRVERLFAFGERLEARWRAAQGQVSALTPSLLAKAFRGELVGQGLNS